MKHLFVGGCADGQWIETDGQRYYRIPKSVKFDFSAGLHKPLMEDTYEVERWRRSDGNEVAIYKLSGSENTLEKLIHGYRPGEAMTIHLSDDSAHHDLSTEDYQRFQNHLYEGGSNQLTLVLRHSDPSRP